MTTKAKRRKIIRTQYPHTGSFLHSMNMLRMGIEQRVEEGDSSSLEELYADVLATMYRTGQELEINMDRALELAETKIKSME